MATRLAARDDWTIARLHALPDDGNRYEIIDGKRALYQAQRIDEYWIVDAAQRTIERWRPDATAAEVAHDRLDWQPVAAHDPLHIDVGAYFQRVIDG
ncbi:MAG: Uma2 family endonuclease [Gemmatimonadota bacterium]